MARARRALSEIYHRLPGLPREEYYSTAIAILTIANIFAIIFAAPDMIGKKYTRRSGEGELVRALPSKPKMMKRPVRYPS